MPDRADYLARTLMSRLSRLHAVFAEDRRGEPDRGQRIAAIEKVLAIEAGVTDAVTLSLIEAAVPTPDRGGRSSDRDMAEFAAFLRRRLAAQLSEP